jgi:hypothetical protein
MMLFYLLLVLTKALKIAAYIGIIWFYRPKQRHAPGTDSPASPPERKHAPRRQRDPHHLVRLCYFLLLLALALELLLYS